MSAIDNMFIGLGNRSLTPIEEELQRISKRLESVCGSSYQRCDQCGQKDIGFSNLMDGTFTCRQCHIKNEAERLVNDPEWIKKEKVWKLRKAISDHKMQSV